MISVTDLRNGTKVQMDGGLWECLDYSHLKMGRGGAKVVTKFRNMESGSIVDRTFNSTEKLQDIFVETKPMQYLYKDGEDFMAGDAAKFLKENMEVEVSMFGEKALKIVLPNQVILKIVETAPGVRGDTVSGGTKPARLEGGALVQVPLFVDQDTEVKVDTRTGEYLSRA